MTERVPDFVDRAAQAGPAFIEVRIKYNPATGQVVELAGPMESPALMFGILELAREVVYVHRSQHLKRLTHPVATGPGLVTV